MKHEKPPSPPPAAFPLAPPLSMSTYFTTLLSPPLSNTIREESPRPPFCPCSPYVQL